METKLNGALPQENRQSAVRNGARGSLRRLCDFFSLNHDLVSVLCKRRATHRNEARPVSKSPRNALPRRCLASLPLVAQRLARPIPIRGVLPGRAALGACGLSVTYIHTAPGYDCEASHCRFRTRSSCGGSGKVACISCMQMAYSRLGHGSRVTHLKAPQGIMMIVHVCLMAHGIIPGFPLLRTSPGMNRQPFVQACQSDEPKDLDSFAEALGGDRVVELLKKSIQLELLVKRWTAVKDQVVVELLPNSDASAYDCQMHEINFNLHLEVLTRELEPLQDELTRKLRTGFVPGLDKAVFDYLLAERKRGDLRMKQLFEEYSGVSMYQIDAVWLLQIRDISVEMYDAQIPNSDDEAKDDDA